MKYQCINSLFFIPIYLLLLCVSNTSIFGQKAISKDIDSISTYFDRTELDTISNIEKLKSINQFLKGAFLYKEDSLIYKGLMRKTNILNKLKLNMSLRASIESDYKTALKAKDKIKISTYRLILSGIKDLDINNRSGSEKKETDDEDIKKLLKKMIKQRSESIELYKKNNRKDLQDLEEQ